jgi:hypothetical protein
MSIKEHVTPQEVVDFLNSLLEIDRDAITKVVITKQSCSEAMANHPTVQCGAVKNLVGPNQIPSGFSDFTVGMVGILNGLFGSFDDGPKKGWGCVAYDLDENKSITKFFIIENKTEE